MKFNDGYWQVLPGVTILRPQAVDDVVVEPESLTVYAATGPLEKRGDTLNRPLVTVSFHSPMDDVVGVTIEHFQGGVNRGPRFELTAGSADVTVSGAERGGEPVATIRSGALTARVATEGEWNVDFVAGDRQLTTSTSRSVGVITDAAGRHFVREQLTLGVGEHVYGLGERFGAFVKNGQTVDIWNADGGTASDQAYKNVPFYLTDAGYGVFVDQPERVSFEVGTEVVSRAQFSVEGQSLRYYVIYGPTPKDILRKLTALTGRPARVPEWSYGLWLSTSFTTDYDETTVTSFIDGMAERDLPLSVFHFDCVWMREFHWTDFVWDPATFPDPAGMLARLKAKGLRICVWINPYIAQRSRLFEEGKAKGYLLRNTDGSVWQWDLWQAGMALVDFTNPAAADWYAGELRTLLGQGVDCFKTDFGERIPTDVVWHDGSDPERMHNWYTQLYNQAVFEVLAEARGEGDAVLFARSATAGGQRTPVHWGGDSTSTFPSMAETLRGGLSLAFSGFGFWSHDIGGFEGTPDAGVYKRWTAFGLLSSHSRFHGSGSYRVPWAFDEEAVEVTRRFTHLKMRLMPYLYAAGLEASERGIPVMRPLQLVFPEDPAVGYLDRQYMLGPELLVAPVLDPDGEAEFYLPRGRWTSLLTGEVAEGGGWRRERHGYDSLHLYVREGAVIPMSERTDRPDHPYLDDLELVVFPGADASGAVVPVVREVRVTDPDGRTGVFTVELDAAGARARGSRADGWSLRSFGGGSSAAQGGTARLAW